MARDRALIDRAVLESVLSVGGAEMRADLLAQIIADLARLETGLRAAGSEHCPAILHELKGLTATIGAGALADMAARLQQIMEDGGKAGALRDRLCHAIAELRLLLSHDTLPAGSA